MNFDFKVRHFSTLCLGMLFFSCGNLIPPDPRVAATTSDARIVVYNNSNIDFIVALDDGSQNTTKGLGDTNDERIHLETDDATMWKFQLEDNQNQEVWLKISGYALKNLILKPRSNHEFHVPDLTHVVPVTFHNYDSNDHQVNISLVDKDVGFWDAAKKTHDKSSTSKNYNVALRSTKTVLLYLENEVGKFDVDASNFGNRENSSYPGMKSGALSARRLEIPVLRSDAINPYQFYTLSQCTVDITITLNNYELARFIFSPTNQQDVPRNPPLLTQGPAVAIPLGSRTLGDYTGIPVGYDVQLFRHSNDTKPSVVIRNVGNVTCPVGQVGKVLPAVRLNY